MQKTLSGRRAGLSAAAELRQELEEEKRRKNAAIDQADPSLTGKGAKTVLRGKLRKKVGASFLVSLLNFSLLFI